MTRLFSNKTMSNNDLSNSLPKRQESSVATNSKTGNGYIQPLSFRDAISRGQDRVIAVVRRDQNDLRRLVSWIKRRLVEVFHYLGAFDIVEEYQIQTLAVRICNRFYYWTVPELDYAFVAFTNGEYGKLVHYNHDGDTSVINPQDVMKALIAFDADLLKERARYEDEQRSKKLAQERLRDASKPHGIAAWIDYCKQHGLDPNTHKLPRVNIDKMNVNKVLYPEKNNKNNK